MLSTYRPSHQTWTRRTRVTTLTTHHKQSHCFKAGSLHSSRWKLSLLKFTDQWMESKRIHLTSCVTKTVQSLGDPTAAVGWPCGRNSHYSNGVFIPQLTVHALAQVSFKRHPPLQLLLNVCQHSCTYRVLCAPLFVCLFALLTHFYTNKGINVNTRGYCLQRRMLLWYHAPHRLC